MYVHVPITMQILICDEQRHMFLDFSFWNTRLHYWVNRLEILDSLDLLRTPLVHKTDMWTFGNQTPPGKFMISWEEVA